MASPAKRTKKGKFDGGHSSQYSPPDSDTEPELTGEEKKCLSGYCWNENTEPTVGKIPKPFGGQQTVSRNLCQCSVIVIHNTKTITHAALLCREPVVVFQINRNIDSYQLVTDGSTRKIGEITLMEKDTTKTADWMDYMKDLIQTSIKEVYQEVRNSAYDSENKKVHLESVAIGFGNAELPTTTVKRIKGELDAKRQGLVSKFSNDKAKDVGNAILKLAVDYTTSSRKTLNGTCQHVGQSVLYLAEALLHAKFGDNYTDNCCAETAGGKNCRGQSDVIYTGPLYDENCNYDQENELQRWEKMLLHYAQPHAEKCAQYIRDEEDEELTGGYATLCHTHDFGFQLPTGFLMVVGECRSGGKTIDEEEMIKVILGILRVLNLYNMGIGMVIAQDVIRVIHCIVDESDSATTIETPRTKAKRSRYQTRQQVSTAAPDLKGRMVHPEIEKLSNEDTDRYGALEMECVEFKVSHFGKKPNDEVSDKYAQFYITVIEYVAALMHKFMEMHKSEIYIPHESLDASKELGGDTSRKAISYGIYNGRNIRYAKKKGDLYTEGLLEGHANVMLNQVTVPTYYTKFPKRKFVEPKL